MPREGKAKAKYTEPLTSKIATEKKRKIVTLENDSAESISWFLNTTRYKGERNETTTTTKTKATQSEHNGMLSANFPISLKETALKATKSTT